ncbi:MAG: formylglycine-generating enzyme family protein, partial [Verrucomicrobiota bacterium]
MIRAANPAFCLAALLFCPGAITAGTNAVPAGMARIPAGVYRPLFPPAGGPKEIPVKSFLLDAEPVTNEQFLEFVRANPRWRRSQVKPLFAYSGYLKHWAGDLDPGPQAGPRQPVIWISWFAANAFAQWREKRLPTTAEWEMAAAASPTRPNGAADPEFQQMILNWYTTPSNGQLPEVGRATPNIWGVHDLHGLVWEWVADFNSALATDDGRGNGAPDRR